MFLFILCFQFCYSSQYKSQGTRSFWTSCSCSRASFTRKVLLNPDPPCWVEISATTATAALWTLFFTSLVTHFSLYSQFFRWRGLRQLSAGAIPTAKSRGMLAIYACTPIQGSWMLYAYEALSVLMLCAPVFRSAAIFVWYKNGGLRVFSCFLHFPMKQIGINSEKCFE